MAELIYTPWLEGNDIDVWHSKTVRFRKSDVVAHVSLSALMPDPLNVPPSAEAWIQSPATPRLDGRPEFHRPGEDAQVHVTTSWLRFWLRVDSGWAAAVGAIFGVERLNLSAFVEQVHWVLFTPDGKVHGIHSLVLLEGAKPVDFDDFERDLCESPPPGVEGELRARRFDPAEFPRAAALGVDPKTGEVFARKRAPGTQID